MRGIILFLFLFLSTVSFAQDVLEVDYTFSTPMVAKFGFSDEKLISIEGLEYSITPGEPILPFKTAKILLPQGKALKDVVATFDEELLPINFEIKYAPYSRPYSVRGKSNIRASYEIRDEFAPELISYKTVQYLHGYPILVVNINPISVNTLKHEMIFRKNVKLKLIFEDDYMAQAIPLKDAGILQRIYNMVDNPDILKSYNRFSVNDESENYDYLIISSQNLINYTGDDGLQSFASFLKTKGLNPKIVSIETISSQVSEIDMTEKIRTFIRNEYQNYKIKYVLLVGDADRQNPVIPTRKLYSKVRGYFGNGNYQDVELDIPSDFTYGCLDGTFNGDGDAKWGEVNDGLNGGDVDFLAEVYVGRIPVDNETQLKSVINKIITAYGYQNVHPKNTLLLGELLFEELNSWGIDYLNQLVGVVTEHGYTTSGYDVNWQVDRLDDKISEWSGDEAQNKINQNKYYMVNHLGHSNSSYNMKLSNWDIQNFSADNYFFYYSQGCYAADITVNDSFVEKLVYSNGGAFGAIANTVYGLGPEDPDPSSTSTPGASNIAHRRFINALFGKGISNIGKAHQISKEDSIGYMQSQEMRWVAWTATYFGDPNLEIK